MKIYITKLLETHGNFTEGAVEVFVLPDSVPEASGIEVLSSCIRNRTWGNWKRLKREVISVKDLTEVKDVTDHFNNLKFISVHLDDAVEQMFVFSGSIDHDTMYEAILAFEDGINGVDTGYRRKLGAGFTDMKTCWGRSATLDLMCREPADTNLLRASLL